MSPQNSSPASLPPSPLRLVHGCKLSPQLTLSSQEVVACLSRAFRSVLRQMRWSMARASQRLKVNRKTIQRWVNGETPVSVETVLTSDAIGGIFLAALAAEYAGLTAGKVAA